MYDLAVAFRMPPSEVLERFSEEEMIRLVAYQNLYGPLSPERFDLLFARLGMDVVAPHLKKGRTPRLKDHLIQWSRKSRQIKTPQQLLSTIRGIQAGFEQAERQRAQRRRRQT